MKLKTRLNSFVRHNKGCQGMYMTFLMLACTAAPPYGMLTTFMTVVTITWLLVWKYERKIDTMQRAYRVCKWNAHTSVMTLIDKKDKELQARKSTLTEDKVKEILTYEQATWDEKVKKIVELANK